MNYASLVRIHCLLKRKLENLQYVMQESLAAYECNNAEMLSVFRNVGRPLFLAGSR